MIRIMTATALYNDLLLRTVSATTLIFAITMHQVPNEANRFNRRICHVKGHHRIHLSDPIVSNFQNDWATEKYFVGKLHFAAVGLKMSFGRISYIAPGKLCTYLYSRRSTGISHETMGSVVSLTLLGLSHYNDVIMSAKASQITSLVIVYSTIYSRRRSKKKNQSSASLAFVRGIHRWPVNSPHNGPVTRKMFPFDDIIISSWLPAV